MAEIKTKATKASVSKYLSQPENATKKEDSEKLLQIFEECTKLKPKLWGNNMIGFGSYHYKSDRSSQEGDWPLTGFSPRKANFTIYIMPGFKNYQDLTNNLGKFKLSQGSCLYIKKLDDIHIPTLKKLIKKSIIDMKKMYKTKS